MTGARVRAVIQSVSVKCNSMVWLEVSLYNIPAALSALSEDLRETDLLIISVVLSLGARTGPVRRFRYCSGGKGS